MNGKGSSRVKEKKKKKAVEKSAQHVFPLSLARSFFDVHSFACLIGETENAERTTKRGSGRKEND